MSLANCCAVAFKLMRVPGHRATAIAASIDAIKMTTTNSINVKAVLCFIREFMIARTYLFMLRKNIGFTLIELIVAMLLIGLLSVIAIPRFINQTSTAQQNSTNSLAAALAAASADNYAKRSANSSSGTAIANCQTIATLLPSSLPSGYTINSVAIANGASASCTLNGLGSTTATFVGIGIS